MPGLQELANRKEAMRCNLKQTRKTVLLIVILPVAAFAHHSRWAYYSQEVSEVEGDLVSVRWRNPHMGFTLRTVNDDGRAELLHMEGGPIYFLERGGITPELFREGTRVRVAGNKALPARRPTDMYATNMLFPDGREVLLYSTVAFRWTDEGLGSRSQWADDEAKQRAAAQNGESLFRIWSIPRENNPLQHLPFTEAALAARGSWDPAAAFEIRCESPGMPGVMDSNHPFGFADQGSEIKLALGVYEIVRTIHMDRSAPPDDEPASQMGYSVGSWDGNILVVKTTNINWPYFDGIGTPQSEAVESLERFSLSEDQTRLDYHMQITDPETFTEPATLERHLLALGETLEVYDCQPY